MVLCIIINRPEVNFLAVYSILAPGATKRYSVHPMSKAVENIGKMSFEDALGELETIVRTLEGGQTPLEESIAAYERGTALKQHCEMRLIDARLRVEKISLSADGKPTGKKPFNPDE